MEKIKLFHSADAHGDLDALKTYVGYKKEKKPDIFLVTGDLIHGVFAEKELEAYAKDKQPYDEKKEELIKAVSTEAEKIGQEKMQELFPVELFHVIRVDALEDKPIIEQPNKEQSQIPSTKDLHDRLKDPKMPIEIRNAIKQYLDAREVCKKQVKKGEASMESQYKEIKKILKGTEGIVIPGNHDGECLEDIMSDMSLHKKDKLIKEIKIAGYGSGDGTPGWIPSELLEPFIYHKAKDPQGNEFPFSDAGKFMMDKDPDIAILHETPLTDDGLKIYTMEEKPYLILAGYMHEMVGVYKVHTDSHIIMPGKLGNAQLPPKDENKLRTFVEIDLLKEKKGKEGVRLQLEKVTYHQIKGNKTEPLLEYKFDKDGVFEYKKPLSKDWNLLGGWL